RLHGYAPRRASSCRAHPADQRSEGAHDVLDRSAGGRAGCRSGYGFRCGRAGPCLGHAIADRPDKLPRARTGNRLGGRSAPMNADIRRHGIGMTSARTRERLVQRLKDNGIRDQRVLDRIRETPRHLFIDEALASRAYEDTALPIGHGQTISQPYVVAKMTEALLAGGPLANVLEVGTGCGYQTAVLAPLVGRINTVERIDPLLVRARRLFRELSLRNVRAKHSDGSWGWPEYAPYDGIIVTAAPEEIPPALLE